MNNTYEHEGQELNRPIAEQLILRNWGPKGVASSVSSHQDEPVGNSLMMSFPNDAKTRRTNSIFITKERLKIA